MTVVPPILSGGSGGGAANVAPTVVNGQDGYQILATDRWVNVYQSGNGQVTLPDYSTLESGHQVTVADVHSNVGQASEATPLTVNLFGGNNLDNDHLPYLITIPLGAVTFVYDAARGWYSYEDPSLNAAQVGSIATAAAEVAAEAAIAAAPGDVATFLLNARLYDTALFGDGYNPATNNLLMEGGSWVINNPLVGEDVVVRAEVHLPAFAVTSELGQLARIQRQAGIGLAEVKILGESVFEELFHSASGMSASAWTSGDLPSDTDYIGGGLLSAALAIETSAAQVQVNLQDFVATTPGTSFTITAHRRERVQTNIDQLLGNIGVVVTIAKRTLQS